MLKSELNVENEFTKSNNTNFQLKHAKISTIYSNPKTLTSLLQQKLIISCQCIYVYIRTTNEEWLKTQK